MKADTTHFPAPTETTELDNALTSLGAALKAVPNGAPTDTAAVKTAATTVRELWGLNAKYAQKVLRALPIEQVPPILANVMLYQSQVGKKAAEAADRGEARRDERQRDRDPARDRADAHLHVRVEPGPGDVAVDDRGQDARHHLGADAGQAVLVPGAWPSSATGRRRTPWASST